MNPEKNDVDINKLFYWGDKFPIVDRYNNQISEVYIRLIGDAEINRARVYAIRRSAELRKALRTEGTDEQVAFISSIYDMDEVNDIIELLLMLYYRKFVREATREVKIPQPKEPRSDATLEEFEKFQAEVDAYNEKRNFAISEYVLSMVEKQREEFLTRPIEQLKALYEKEMINELCEKEMINKFGEMSTYYGLFEDPEFKIRAFDTFEQFENLPTEIKEQYIDYYRSLEINIDELKKSQEAMR